MKRGLPSQAVLLREKDFLFYFFYVHTLENCCIFLRKFKVFVRKNVVMCRIFVQKNVDMERNVIKQLLAWKQKRAWM